MSIIRDSALASEGVRRIDWVKCNMPILRELEQEFIKSKPFAGAKLTVSVHLEAKTAYLVSVLAAGGANVAATGSNPLSTQDAVAAGLATLDNVEVYAWHGATAQEYLSHIESALDFGPDVIIDDGGDLINMLHTKRTDLIGNVLGGCEETTTGILRLRAMEKEGVLKFPMIAVNDAMCKHLFDNRYGTGQSVWDGITRTTNLIVCGKTVVVAGYGWCGKGIAMRAKGLGARVIVTEIDPIKAIEAHMDGFDVMKMSDAAPLGDFFITATGCKDVVTREHFPAMKDEAILCNAGHFDCEVSRADLEAVCASKRERRANIMGYTLENGKTLNLLGEGRLVNLAAGDGHPAEIMDMSFAIQALSARYVLENKGKLENKVISVPKDIDGYVASAKLKSLGLSHDILTREQTRYLESWSE